MRSEGKIFKVDQRGNLRRPVPFFANLAKKTVGQARLKFPAAMEFLIVIRVLIAPIGNGRS
jgi:hypothetical protein